MSWTERRTSPHYVISKHPNLFSTIYSRLLIYFGHISRATNMEKLVVSGKPEGMCNRGRSTYRRIDTIKKVLGASPKTTVRTTANCDGEV